MDYNIIVANWFWLHRRKNKIVKYIAGNIRRKGLVESNETDASLFFGVCNFPYNVEYDRKNSTHSTLSSNNNENKNKLKSLIGLVV